MPDDFRIQHTIDTIEYHLAAQAERHVRLAQHPAQSLSRLDYGQMLAAYGAVLAYALCLGQLTGRTANDIEAEAIDQARKVVSA